MFTKKISTVASCGKSLQLLWEDLGLSALLKGRTLQLANMIKTWSQGCAKFRIEKKQMAPFQFFWTVWVWKYPQEIVCLSVCPVFLSGCCSNFQSVCCCLSVTLLLYLSLCRLLDALPISHSIFYVCMFACCSVCLHVALSVCCSFKMLNIF